MAAPPATEIVMSVAALADTAVPVSEATPPIAEDIMLPIVKLIVWLALAPTWKLALEKEPSKILCPLNCVFCAFLSNSCCN